MERREFCIALSLLAIGVGRVRPASATTTAGDFGGTVSYPDLSSVTLTADIRPSVTAGQAGYFFVGALMSGTDWYFWNPIVGWSGPYTTVSPEIVTPAYSGPLVPTSFTIASGTDLRSYVETQVYVGYGRSAAEMLANGTYALIYNVGGIIPMGIKVMGASQLPAGCDRWAKSCWADSVASGVVKFVATTATMTGYNDRPVKFAFFRNSAGLWNVLPMYADDGSLVGPDIFGGGNVEFDWAMGTVNGVLIHTRVSGKYYEISWNSTEQNWSTYLVNYPQ